MLIKIFDPKTGRIIRFEIGGKGYTMTELRQLVSDADQLLRRCERTNDCRTRFRISDRLTAFRGARLVVRTSECCNRGASPFFGKRRDANSFVTMLSLVGGYTGL